MKVCRTINGLLKAIEKAERCCLRFTSKAVSGSGGYIIYQANGTNLMVSEQTYQKIEPFLVHVK